MIKTQITARSFEYPAEYNSGVILTEPSSCYTVRQLLKRSLNGIPTPTGNQVWQSQSDPDTGVVPELHRKNSDLTDFLNTRARTIAAVEQQAAIKRKALLEARKKDADDLAAFRKAAAQKPSTEA